VTRRCTCSPRCTATNKPLRTRWATGRFAVVDGSGVAVIDGAPLDLWRKDREHPEDGLLGLSHGDEVRVLGVAEPVEAPDVMTLGRGAAGYRDAPRVLGFAGTDRKPVCVLV